MVVALLISARPADEIMTRKGNTTIVNTTQLGAQVRGFKGATPVLIHIEKNKVVKVEALPNRETPKFFARAKAVLQQFEGLTVAKAQNYDICVNSALMGVEKTAEMLAKLAQIEERA